MRLILDDEVDIGDSVGKNVCSAVPKWIQPIQSFDMEAIFQLPDIGAIYLADYFSSAFLSDPGIPGVRSMGRKCL